VPSRALPCGRNGVIAFSATGPSRRTASTRKDASHP
jgi:hypothetical protein